MLQTSWVDHLFAKLTVRYGAAFTRQYADLDPALVKADWAEVLDGFTGDALTYALRYLPTGAPPNALQFRDICRRAPPPVETPRLQAPPVPFDRQRWQELRAQLGKALGSNAEQSLVEKAKAGIKRLRTMRDQGQPMSAAQRAFLETVDHNANASEMVVTTAGKPIPFHTLPPGMQADMRDSVNTQLGAGR